MLRSFLLAAILAASIPAHAAPITLHFHGNTHDSGPDGTPCSGNGTLDSAGCVGPFLLESSTLDDAPAASFTTTSNLSDDVDQGGVDPAWAWSVPAPITVSGSLVLSWWASCDLCISAIALPDNWIVSLWADGIMKYEQPVSATPAIPFIPSLLTATLSLPAIPVNSRLVVKIDANYSDAQAVYQIFYDSNLPCPGSADAPCDSTATFFAPPADADGDSVLDADDRCAGTRAGSRVDRYGCELARGATSVSTSTPGVPRYQVFEPTAGTEAASETSGEFNIGFNPYTGAIMTMSALDGYVFKVTPPERLDPVLPESCDALWQNKAPVSTSAGQPVGDPILWTDQDTGRTFAANLTAGPNLSYAFSDDDGDNWFPLGASGVTGADHETIGTGPYPPGSPYAELAKSNGYPNAVYYCSQGGIRNTGPVGCVRSDDGGRVFGPTQKVMAGDPCGGLHGHIKVAADGSAYLPIRTCREKQGAAYTRDAGDSWQQFQVPNTWPQVNGSDPSIGIDQGGALYFCYVNGDGHAHAQVSLDRGKTWSLDTDLGKPFAIKNAAFPQAVAGSPGRAACGFLGTPDGHPNYESLDFQGVWHLYIATTYDGGKHWVTVNATPNDPVQGAGGIWQAGGTETNRNLLDFNEVTIDDRGRVLFGFNDGCVGACVSDPVHAPTYVGQMRVARQTGGRSLYAAFDGQTDTTKPITPKPPCVSGKRDIAAAHLAWKTPDDGGAAITGYRVYRQAGTGHTDYVARVKSPEYTDSTVSPDVGQYRYFVKAVTEAGASLASNTITLGVDQIVPPESACVLPGLTLVTSPAGTTSNGLPSKQDDLRTIWFAEPKAQSGKLVITIKVDNLSPQPPPGYRWIVYFSKPGDSTLYWAGMSTVSGPAPVFTYGSKGQIDAVTAPVVGTLAVGTFTPMGDLDPASQWNADGTITLVLPYAALGLKAGDQLKDIAGSIRQSTPDATDNMGLTVDSATAIGPYALVGSTYCKN